GLLPIPEKHQALSIGLDLTRQVAGFVTPGDNVGMVLTLPVGDGGTRTRFLLQNVRVLAVGATALTTRTAQGGGGRVNQGKGSQTLTAITLAIKQDHVERVVHAAEDGDIYLTLMPRNADAAPRNERGITDDNVIPEVLE
ncbi:MAG TPA: RcpC/CpaB family pilus assembly protein, partial [Propionibacteriaceae bacterium]|nr:RcpC/CpaB family pilus assembly protein [Propionibacteriaceae bacterium]